jgi:cytoskeleton protein RodZ
VSIGREIASARAQAGLTVEQVSAATRIRATIISAIEQDDFSKSGGDFYARAHIRSIAQVVHTDPAPLLEQFDAAVGGDDSPSASAVFESETNARPERRGPNWSAAMAAALALLVVYGGVQYFADQDEPRGTEILAGTDPTPAPNTPAAPQDEPKATEPATRSSDDAIAQARPNRVVVELDVSDGKSWVSVTNAAGETLFSGLLDEGQKKRWTDRREIKMTIGNAGAVNLVVNGKRVGAPGGDGEVARVQFTPTDPDNA